MNRIAITGGGGFVGSRLALELFVRAEKANQPIEEIRLLDIQPPNYQKLYEHYADDYYYSLYLKYQDRLHFVFCDLRNETSVHQALTSSTSTSSQDTCKSSSSSSSSSSSIDVVFHLASYGMSGYEMLDFFNIEQINVQGTQYIIQACQQFNISKLLYLSTYNVCFYTQPIINGNEENTNYVPDQLFHDAYSKTKKQAEILILKANGTKLCNGTGVLHSTSLRPAGIWGDGESRHFPRIFANITMGLGVASIGSTTNLVDWVWIDNLTHALILAAQKLEEERIKAAPLIPSSCCSGQAFFINDNHPINQFEFLKPICAGIGYEQWLFLFALPTSFMYYLAWFFELIYYLIYTVSRGTLKFQPFLTRTEVLKVGCTHYFTTDKARRVFGYKPLITHEEALKKCIEYYRPRFGKYRQQRVAPITNGKKKEK